MIKGGDKGFTKTPKKKPSIAKQIIKKGIKFGTKIAFSPLTIGLAAGAGAVNVIKRGERTASRSQTKQYTKRGNWVA
jgi:hypothetical protein